MLHRCTPAHTGGPPGPHCPACPPSFSGAAGPARGNAWLDPLLPASPTPPQHSKAPEVTGGGAGEPTGLGGGPGARLRARSLSSPATKGLAAPVPSILCLWQPFVGTSGQRSRAPPSSDSHSWGPQYPPLLGSPSSLTPVSPLPGSSPPLPLLSTLGVPEAWLFLLPLGSGGLCATQGPGSHRLCPLLSGWAPNLLVWTSLGPCQPYAPASCRVSVRTSVSL